MNYLIINGDDFGWSNDVVDSIISGFNNGVITSTSVMTTMPAYEYGIEQLRKNPRLSSGVHLSLFDGKPVLPKEKVNTLIDPGTGMFLPLPQIKKNIKHINSAQVAAEYEAQVEKFLTSGLKPTHLDIHCHLPYLHKKWLAGVFKLAQKYNLPMRTPIGRDYKEKSKMLARKIKIPAFIIQIKSAGLLKQFTKSNIPHPDYFISEFSDTDNNAVVENKIAYLQQILKNLNPGLTELLTHPSNADEKWRAIENQVWNDSRIIEFVNRQEYFMKADYKIFTRK